MSVLKQIVVRADGNKDIGFGHVYRTIALANIFSENTSVTYISPDLDTKEIIPENFNFELIEGNETEFIINHFSPDEHTIMLDGYNYDHTYQAELKKAGFSLVFIDDMVGFEMVADVVLNPSLGVSKADYTGQNVRYALGPKFACLRSPFLKASKESNIQKPVKEFKKVLISFGGSDPFHLSEKIINLCNDLGLEELHVLKGKSFDNNLISENTQSKIFYHQQLNAEELVKLIQSVDLTICSASTISYEVASVGKPLMVGWYAENQINLYEGLLANNIAKGIGNLLKQTVDEIQQDLKEKLREDFSEQLDHQKAHFDGFNNERLMSLLLPLISNLKIRPVNNEDVKLLHEWANDSDVRANSLSPDPIPFESHENWFKSKLESPNSYIYIIEIASNPIGQIRFDLNENDQVEIDYSIDKNYRGQGLGKHIVALGIDQLRRSGREERIIAQVKRDNLASSRVFLSIGFTESDFSEKEDIYKFEYFTAT